MKPIPTIIELNNKVTANLKTKLDLAPGELKMVLDVVSSTVAGELKMLYLFLKDLEDNLFPDTASTVENGGTLERFGQIRLNRIPFQATQGIYTAVFEGSDGAVLRSQLTFKSSENSSAPGNLYILENEYTLVGTDGTISIRSLDTGLEYKLAVGDELVPTEPVLGLDGNIYVSVVTQAPKDAEDTEVYREKIIDSIQLEPQGGAKTDYRLWAADAQGVRTVYPYVKNGEPGTVQVFVEAVIADSMDGNGTPDPTLISDVEDVINFDPDTTKILNERGRLPTQANLEVLPIEPVPVDINISGLQNNTLDVRNKIEDNIRDFLYDVRPYVAGADLPRDKNDTLTSVKTQSVVSDTIGNANTFLSFQLYVAGVNVNSYVFSFSKTPYLRNLTFS